MNIDSVRLLCYFTAVSPSPASTPRSPRARANHPPSERPPLNRIAILGAGPAGYVGALRAAQLGAQVTLIEERWLGGTCLHVGCIPTKTLVHAATLYTELSDRSFKKSGLEIEGLRFNVEKLGKRRDQTVRRLVTGVRGLLEKAGVELIEARGRLEEPGVLAWETDDGGSGRVEADYALLCTGSEPSLPPVPGIELAWTSERAVALPEVPEELLIIGAGVIGLEFACIYSALGSRVTVVEMLDRALPMEDAELGEALAKQLKRAGIKLLTGIRVLGIEESAEGGCEVTLTENGDEQDLRTSCDRVLVATGRKPRLNGVDAEALGLELQRGAIVVDARLRTTLERTYAAGDCIGGHMLAHVASYEAETAVEHMLTDHGEVHYDCVPRSVFSIPEISAVGCTEDEAAEAGIEVLVGRFPYRASGKALAGGHSEGFVKVIADASNNRVIGGGVFGSGASELISEIALACRHKLTLDDVADTIHSHPTLPEMIREASLDALGRPLHI
ncbi:MAG: dihydrolipoyl dehydrogenase [Candidatus Coatesbacteria bacterium]|nr:dihydrolipoyl dehydrogenase [Candidatus Coatesbacteria bacterium]